jgi:hypothetical protein
VTHKRDADDEGGQHDKKVERRELEGDKSFQSAVSALKAGTTDAPGG